ncbi:hypothetical protein MTR_1g023390 [Medicago truncatula]|uniref:Uncharacterized protein n=1 Tax=Medicago truncatula TaxID=3880 RepID=G7I5X4_MEDTR|nr:hypothetical protein MTR_1g023390 [Medicago truncatula]
MVQIISVFLEETNVLYWFSEIYKAGHLKPNVISSWPQLIELFAFDKKMQSHKSNVLSS